MAVAAAGKQKRWAAMVDPFDWTLNGNAGTNPSNNFVGTTDNQPLVIRTNATEAARVDTAGQVGIGTTSPGARLHVLGPGGGAVVAAIEQPVGMNFVDLRSSQGGGNYGSDIRFVDSGVVNAEVKSTANSQLRFATSGVDRVTIDSNGNVGIGTTSPGGKLHVNSGSDFRSPQVVITQTTPSDFARLQFRSFFVDVDQPGVPQPFPLWDIAAGRGVLNVFRQDTGNVMTLTGGREPGAAVFTPRVGIGTEAPATTLDVNGTATVRVLQIIGGSDLAERFPVEGDAVIEPGTVMVIDDGHPGKLRVSDKAYDRKLAGIVSGGGGAHSGLVLGQELLPAAEIPVALTGRVYCKAEAVTHPIEPGDMLTSSDIPGHAMKAVNASAAQGAILGKAMTPLKEGKGLVLVLVNLQ
jgi:hypothetical protein